MMEEYHRSSAAGSVARSKHLNCLNILQQWLPTPMDQRLNRPASDEAGARRGFPDGLASARAVAQ